MAFNRRIQLSEVSLRVLGLFGRVPRLREHARQELCTKNLPDAMRTGSLLQHARSPQPVVNLPKPGDSQHVRDILAELNLKKVREADCIRPKDPIMHAV
jgi:hypothetical protein